MHLVCMDAPSEVELGQLEDSDAETQPFRSTS